MKQPSLKRIRSAANIYFGVDVSLNTRVTEIRLARQITHYVSHKKFNHSQSTTGKAIGNKDHATVLHSCKSIENYLFYDKQVQEDVRRLTNKCRIKEKEEDPVVLMKGILKNHNINIHTKIELRQILKLIKS